MTQSQKLLALLILFCVAVLGVFFLIKAEKEDEQAENPRVVKGVKVGKEAPNIIGEDIDGKEFKLSDYRGKVVMLDFWGFW